MSIINMFRKEALRHQYKSQEFGNSVIKQPSIINNSIIALCIIIIVTTLTIQFVTLSTSQTYDVVLGADNYYPLAMSKAVVISQQLVTEGALVSKDQPLANINIINELEQADEQRYLRASKAGIYFQSQTNSTIVPAYQAIGYLLDNSILNDFSLWLQQEPRKPVRIGQSVNIIINQQAIEGRVSMIVGSFVAGKGQKILVTFSSTRHLSLLSPTSSLQIKLNEQPKTIAQLLL
ncbi:hypothetical protein G3479_19660 [Shewanella baltica]|uniref:hypothetical protein n=1 Tax=Shewanella baltica TaxID=62322 RepID=UPI00217CF722|nr:hypothetical protein [Shewanella baltica]MCS6261422.1 hypothetical protein [Shewanella baltica]